MIPYRELARKRGVLPAASNARQISDDTVLGIGEVAQGGEGKTSELMQERKPNDGSMGSTVYLLILTQHEVPELGLAEVTVDTGKQATPHQATVNQR